MTLESVMQSRTLSFIEKHRGILLPFGVIALFFVLLVPLPTPLLDFLLAANITLAAVILLTTMYLNHPLELSSFPSLLLSMTIFRLSLNIATTRLILTNAHQGTAAAGRVIETFGNFVTAGSVTVGVVIFLILIVMQFVVVTKGSTRIAEVAARFTLDGMPGKQMAVDAEFNAGLIDENEARRRRDQITQEADFYGAMDGASKFVRGDAIAALIITGVNIVGGLYVGIVHYHMGLAQCLDIFTRLTVGDGLVAAIPAFMIAVGAGMLVTRSSSKTNLGEDLLSQLTAKPAALAMAAVFLGLLLFTRLPMAPLLLLAAGCGGLAYFLHVSRKVNASAEEPPANAGDSDRIESLLGVDPMEFEIGFGLIKLTDNRQGGDLLDRIAKIRRQIAAELGIVVPPIRVRDNLKLEPDRYAIRLRGVEVAQGRCLPGHLLAVDDGRVDSPITGIQTAEPVFSAPALWIGLEQKAEAEQHNYSVVSCPAVLATHLTEVIRQHAHELLTRQQTHKLLDNLKADSPKVVEDVIPELIKIGDLQRVLQNLLREQVPIRDLETILETLSEWAPRASDPDILTQYVRNALAGTICQMYKDTSGVIRVAALDPAIEDLLDAHLEHNDRGTYLSLPPETQNKIISAVDERIRQLADDHAGHTIAVITSPQIRILFRRLIEPALPHVPVLSFNEIARDIEVRSLGLVVLADEFENVPG